MKINKKAAQVAGTGTASKTAFDSRNHTVPDPLIGCNLAKPSRNRQQKRSWQRGKQRGRMDAYLAGQLVLLVAVIFLIVGGVTL
jgi:hypothetical protein